MRIQRKSVSEISKPPFSKSTLSLLTRSVPLESCVSLLSRYTTRFVFPTRFRFEIQRNLQRHSLKNAKLTVGSVFWLSTADVITIPNHHIAILSRENCQSSKTTWKAHALQFWSDSDQKYDFHKIVRNLLQSGIRYPRAGSGGSPLSFSPAATLLGFELANLWWKTPRHLR